jgi:steroid 5-alpha reductase family enzyme
MSLARPLPVLGLVWVSVGLVMLVLWLLQRRSRNATAVDFAWAAALGGAAILCALLGVGNPMRRALLASMVAVASGRLAWHLYVDRARSGIEDGRYRDLRERWGVHAQRNFFFLYQIQALLVAWLSIPFVLAGSSGTPLGTLDLAALAMWSIALAGELLSDAQLARFRREPANRGHTCRVGLWRLSRHPNYFFQWCLWVAYALPALAAPWGVLGLLAPLTMLFLILFVTGVPPTEQQALRSRGEDYRAYQRTTSVFVPWFPRSEGSRCGSKP